MLSAETSLDKVPPMVERTLRISEDLSGFEYQYWVCKKRFIICLDKEMKIERWPFNDKVKIKALLDAGFVLRVRERI